MAPIFFSGHPSFPHLQASQCSRALFNIFEESCIWPFLAKKLVSQGIPLPYEGFETAEELNPQDVKRVVLKAFRRENAWSQSTATPLAIKTCKLLTKGFIPNWIKAATSDLVAVYNGWKLVFFRPSDLSSVDVYGFREHEAPVRFEWECDHEENTFIVFAPAVRRIK